MEEKRSGQRYPLRIQSFEKLRREGYVYVDKTEYIIRLLNNGYYFLSRPRRFGKSLLLSTLESFFLGKKELFEGLAIYEWEKDWIEYPVFHFDLNAGQFDTLEGLKVFLDTSLKDLEEIYGRKYENNSFSLRLKYLLESAHEQTGRPVVVLVDEYEKPILSAVGDEGLQDKIRDILKPFYGTLKSCDEHIRFAMLTGVTRLGKMSVFSDLNNLIDISMADDYAGICGITMKEMLPNLGIGIENLAVSMKLSEEETIKRLKKAYDGYRFAEKGPKVFNPFSLLNSLNARSIRDYWFSTGTPSYLMEVLKKNRLNLWNLDGIEIDINKLTDITSFSRDVVPLLYQSGYLTIKDFDNRFHSVKLGYPNEEVRRGFTNSLLYYYVGDKSAESFHIRTMCQSFERGDVDTFMESIRCLFSSIPYVEVKDFSYEGEFRNIMYIVLTLLGFYVDVEKHISRGRIDLVAKTARFVYVMEFKTEGTPEEALAQIEEKGYGIPYTADSRSLIKVEAVFSASERNLTAWKAEK